MFWFRRRIKQENAVMDDPEVIAVLQEITARLNSTSTQLRDFSSDLQVNINRLKRYAASAEKKVQGDK